MYLNSYLDYNLNMHDIEEEVELAFSKVCKNEMSKTIFEVVHYYTSFEGSFVV